MNKRYNFKCNKLIRDKRYQRMVDTGVIVEGKELNQYEAEPFVKAKLIEEVHELTRASGDELLEEIADVFEVLDCLMKLLGVKKKDIDEIIENKRTSEGGFDNLKFCKKISVPEGHSLVEYCKNRPQDYPEEI